MTIRADDVAIVTDFISLVDQRQILRLLRDETTELILRVRLKNQERREQIEKEKQLDEELRVRGSNDGSLFDQP